MVQMVSLKSLKLILNSKFMFVVRHKGQGTEAQKKKKRCICHCSQRSFTKIMASLWNFQLKDMIGKKKKPTFFLILSGCCHFFQIMGCYHRQRVFCSGQYQKATVRIYILLIKFRFNFSKNHRLENKIGLFLDMAQLQCIFIKYFHMIILTLLFLL